MDQRINNINNTALKMILLLMPVFIIPAVAAVILIKRFELSSLGSMLAIFAALGVSWIFVMLLVRWSKQLISKK